MTVQITSSLSVDGDRLTAMIQQLAHIGKLPNGGVQRLAFSPEDYYARALVRQWMIEANMTVRIDEAGNLIGRYPGRFDVAPPLVTGSHIDTVPNAGYYDGAYGVIAGIEVVRTLDQQNILLDHPIEVIVFADEERTMIGCKAMAGHLLEKPDLYSSRDQEPIQDCLKRIGGNWEIVDHARRSPGSMTAFVEVHVEQGPVLTSQGKQIGVVTGIVGQQRYWITVEGQSSHAGTTPMSMRQDALVAAAQIVLAINHIGNQPGDQVATVGRMEIFPNVANSIPGKVEMSLDLRDLCGDRLDQLLTAIEQAMDDIAIKTQTQIAISQRLKNTPVLASSHIQNAIIQACEDLNLSYCRLPSRASHDAQEIASIADMGMIFVPSEGGISHAETEYTSKQDCVNGAQVLLQTLISLDQHNYRSNTNH